MYTKKKWMLFFLYLKEIEIRMPLVCIHASSCSVVLCSVVKWTKRLKDDELWKKKIRQKVDQSLFYLFLWWWSKCSYWSSVSQSVSYKWCMVGYLL